MKCLVLLSLVAYCTCVPVTISKHVTVDVNIERPDETLDQSREKPSYWNQQYLTEEPRYEQATPDFLNNWYQKYLQQYLPWAHTKETTYGADFPRNQYSKAREFEELTPAQLLLNYFKSQKSDSLRFNDVSDEEYLQKMLNQHVPEYLRENMQIPYIPVQFMQRALKQLYKNLGEVPYTREQIMNYVIDNVEDFPNNHVSQRELEQLVEYFHHLQSLINLRYQRQGEQTMGYEKMEQLNPWARFFQNLRQNIVERQNQQFYQHWEQPQAHYYQGKVPTGQEWRFPLSRDWSQRMNFEHTEFPQQWAHYYQENVPAGQEWSRDWSQRMNFDQTEFPQQWAHFYQEKVPAGQEWSRDWSQRMNFDQTEFPQQWAHFYHEKVPAGQEWRFPWSHDWNQKVNVDQTELPQQWSVQRDVPQLWQWNRDQYPQRWNLHKEVPQVW